MEVTSRDLPSRVVDGLHKFGRKLGIENVLPELKVKLPRAATYEALVDLRVGDEVELGDYSIIPAGVLGDKDSYKNMGMNGEEGFKAAIIEAFLYQDNDKVGVFVRDQQSKGVYLVDYTTGIIAKNKDNTGFFSPFYYDKGISVAYRKSIEDPSILNNLKTLQDRIRKTDLPVAGSVKILIEGLFQLFGNAARESQICIGVKDLISETFTHPIPRQASNPSLRLGEVTASFDRHAYTKGIYSMTTEDGVRFFRVAERQYQSGNQIAIEFYYYDINHIEDKTSLRLIPNLTSYYLPADVVPVTYYSGGVEQVNGYLKEAKEESRQLAKHACIMFLEVLMLQRGKGR